MSERFNRRKFISRVAAKAVEVAAENPQITASIVLGAGLLLANPREVRAAVLSAPGNTENNSCAPFNGLEKSEVDQCINPNNAAIYLTAEVFANKNGKPGFQSNEGDEIKRKFTEAEYLVVNTADRSQSYNARVNEFGELYYEKEDADGKKHQVRIFVFSGESNAVAENGMSVIKIEVRNKNAYDKSLRRVVELGDPRYFNSAKGCTPLPGYLWKDESYLTPPSIVEAPPPSTTKTPDAPVQLPPAQVPVQLPRSGDGSTETPELRNQPHITPWHGAGR